ncbi:MAG: molecular chaperone SurA, partial [Xanthomonadales bacterium]|nr:molecular chaperone SurA [Xanthomonadales bacterium]
MTRFLALVVLALALAALGAAQGARAQALSTDPVDRIVAVVDEDVILQSELDRAVGNILAQYAGRPGQLPAREVIERQVLERLITIRL